MNRNFYIPVKSTSLPIYFGNACIAPSIYYTNKLEDIQDKFSEYVLLSDNLCVLNSDSCLEVLLNEQEVSELKQINSNVYLLNKPLPITRVNFIYFNSQSQLEYTITNINLSTAFIPKRLLKVSEKFENINIDNIELPKEETLINWQNEIKRYNSILGGFAIMKNTGEDYMNYSENYFSTLSFFNTAIEKELVRSEKKIESKFFDAFTGTSSFKKLIPILNKEVDENDLNFIAKEENQLIVKDKFTKIIDLTALKNATLITAILHSYGVGEESRKKRIDGLILSNFTSDLPSDKSEVIALCYGLNRGYSIFPNKYKLGDKEKFIKFKLDSKVDYYTIESIYQFAFNKSHSDSFQFIDKIQFGNSTKLASRKSTDYFIFDTLVIGKKKPKVLSKEYLSNLLHIFFQKDNSSIFSDLFEKIISILHKDILEEVNDENVSNKSKIENTLKFELEEKQLEIDRLENIIKELTSRKSEINLVEEKSVEQKELDEYRETKIAHLSVDDTDMNFSKTDNPDKKGSNFESDKNNNDKKEIIKLVENYLKKQKPDLEKEAKEKGLKPKGNTSKDDLIIMLLNSHGKINNEQELKFQ